MTEPAPRSFVIGAGGLLGSEVMTATNGCPVVVHWDATPAEDLDDFAQNFPIAGGRVAIYWCAGRAVSHATKEELDVELAIFERFLRSAEHRLRRDRTLAIDLFLASSVGGVYGASPSPPYTEATPPAPASPYGRGKLRGERVASAWAKRTGSRVLLGRLSNIYGARQDLTKGQGLISTLIAAALTKEAATIGVPLETKRDYILARDASVVAAAGMERIATAAPGTVVTKIIASGRPTSVGDIILAVERELGQRVPLNFSESARGAVPTDFSVNSEVWEDLDSHASTSLTDGIRNLISDLRESALSPRPDPERKQIR